MAENTLLSDLPEEKIRLIEKYRLVPKSINNRIYWVQQFSGKPDHPYVTHRAMRKCHVIDLVFSFYDLCVAKMTYFKKNIQQYEPCKANWRSGSLERCELWDMEFLVQIGTGIAVDLRNLKVITDIAVFREMCAWLEMKLMQRDVNQRQFLRQQELRVGRIPRCALAGAREAFHPLTTLKVPFRAVPLAKIPM